MGNSQERLVTIDGPAGCGKSTVTRRLARELGAIALNSGLLYRAVTLLAWEAGFLQDPSVTPSTSELEAIRELVRGSNLSLVIDENRELSVRVEDRQFGQELSTSEVTERIHWLARDSEIRSLLLPLQRQLKNEHFLLAEGRDMGSVVFPEALVKVFLTASVEERARRRFEELRNNGVSSVSLAELEAQVKARDERDQSRSVAPLKVPVDAVTVDTTGLDIEEVVATLAGLIPEDWRS